ncbi:MAG: MipA/OmpV family protein [Burkholderiaceae bacterium]
MIRLLLRTLGLCLFVLPAWSSAQTPGSARLSYAIGLVQSFQPDYPGSRTNTVGVRPIIGVRYKRFRISSSGGSSVLRIGKSGSDDAATGSGASADLFSLEQMKVRAELRIANGRGESDSAVLSGLPSVDRTLIGRLSTAYPLTKNLTLSGQVAWDILGRNNGVLGSFGMHYGLPMSNKTEWSMGTSVSWANSTHMNAWFGVPLSAQTVNRRAYSPGGGLRSFDMYMGVISQVGRDWVAFARFEVTRNLGPAADSPLTQTTVGAAAKIGVGYRCCAR